MNRESARLAGRAVQLALALALAGVVGTEACEAIVTDSLPNLPCQPDDEIPSETCPSGQMCSDAGRCVDVLACDGSNTCLADALADAPRDALGEAGIDSPADGVDDTLADGSGDGNGDDGGDDGGGGDAPNCDSQQGAVGCPCTDTSQCGSRAPHCMLIVTDAGPDDASGDAGMGYCSHGCKTDEECTPLTCSAQTRACAP